MADEVLQWLRPQSRVDAAAWDRSSEADREELRARLEDMVKCMVAMPRDDDGYALCEANTRLFVIVRGFFQKTGDCPAVALMMAEVVEDFVWPQLESVCPVRRCNAADLFFLAHPIVRPELAAQQARRAYLLRQHEAMLALLEDDRHTARYVAVRGVCVALSNYWHVFAADSRKKLLKSLFSERPYDGDWRVRRQVYRYSRKLLRCDEAVDALQELLPDLRNCFHDVNGSVRLAFVELLHAIKQAGSFPFFYAVPVDHLVARLREEPVEANVHSLVRLLLPYFCPLEEPPAALFRRIFSLYRMSAEALWKLFLHSEVVLLKTEALRVMSCILTGVHDSVRRSRRSSSRSRSSSRGGAARAGRGRAGSKRLVPADQMKPSDPDGAAALLQVAGILWKTRVEHGKGHGGDEAAVVEQIAELRATLQRVVPFLLEALKDTEAHSSLQVLSGACRAAAGTGARRESMQAVRMATEDNAALVIEAHMDTLMNQDGVPELTTLLSRAVTFSWARVPGDAGVLPSAAAALIMVRAMLGADSHCAALVERHYDALAGLAAVLKNFQTLLSTRLGRDSPLSGRRTSKALTDDFMQCGFDTYLSLVARLGAATSAQAKATAIAQSVDVLNWAEQSLVPLLAGAAQAATDVAADADDHDTPLVVRLARIVLLHAGAMVSSRLYDAPFLASCVEFCHLVMNPARACHKFFFVLIVDLVVSALAVFLSPDSEQAVDGRGLMKNHIFPTVSGLLDLLPEVCASSAEAARKKEAVMLASSAAYQALLACELHLSDSPELQSGLIAAIAWNVMEIVHVEVETGGGAVRVPSRARVRSIADLPLSCSYLVAPLQCTSSRTRELVQSLRDWLGRDCSNVASRTASVELVLRALASGPVEKAAKKLIQGVLNEIAGKKSLEARQPEQLDVNSNSLDWSLFSDRNSSTC